MKFKKQSIRNVKLEDEQEDEKNNHDEYFGLENAGAEKDKTCSSKTRLLGICGSRWKRYQFSGNEQKLQGCICHMHQESTRNICIKIVGNGATSRAKTSQLKKKFYSHTKTEISKKGIMFLLKKVSKILCNLSKTEVFICLSFMK